jgi:hypothetical protein
MFRAPWVECPVPADAMWREPRGVSRVAAETLQAPCTVAASGCCSNAKGPRFAEDRKPRNVNGLPDPQWSGARHSLRFQHYRSCRSTHPDRCIGVPHRSRAHGVMSQDLEDGSRQVARICVAASAVNRGAIGARADQQ